MKFICRKCTPEKPCVLDIKDFDEYPFSCPFDTSAKEGGADWHPFDVCGSDRFEMHGICADCAYNDETSSMCQSCKGASNFKLKGMKTTCENCGVNETCVLCRDGEVCCSSWTQKEETCTCGKDASGMREACCENGNLGPHGTNMFGIPGGSPSEPPQAKDPKARYYDAGGLETLDVIKAKLTPEQFKGWLLGNLIKYSCRANHKGQFARDIEKVRFYSAELFKNVEV